MTISEFIVKFFEEKNIDTIFTIPGGGCIFLTEAFGNSQKIKSVVNHHEQGSALAAEGYARTKNSPGLCLVTSGPGGSNAWTGTLCSYQDSIPVFFISGNVNKSLTTNYTQLNLRQLGDQEFNVVKTVSNFTKYAYQINDPLEIRYQLEKAYYLAISGRPGPVWLDIPLDIQTASIDPEVLQGYNQVEENISKTQNNLETIAQLLNKSKKPLIIAGHGVKLSKSQELLNSILEKHKIPVITSFNGNDSTSNEYEYYCGRFGTHAQIAANQLVQEADLILSLGSRLYVRQIGYNFDDFGRNAYKIYVDIDNEELNKPTLRPDIKVNMCVKDFLTSIEPFINIDNISAWRETCKYKYMNYPTVLDKHRNDKSFSIYAAIEQLNNYMRPDLPIITSDGSANIVGMQVIKLKKNQILFSNKSTAPMGYGLPAAIGACYGNARHPVLCLEGDGSLHMNIHELQVLKQNNLPVKILLINNDGYVSIKITQKTFCNKLCLSDSSSGLTLPDYKKIASAYGIEYLSSISLDDYTSKLSYFVNNSTGPIIFEIFVNPKEYHEPKVIASLDNNGKFIPGKLDNINWIDT
jgi:acetolactate synthase-1/2/3 large subunit